MLMIVDRLSKYVKIIPTATNDDSGVPAAEPTAQLFLQHWVRMFGIPRSIVSDRDPQFSSVCNRAERCAPSETSKYARFEALNDD